MAGVSTTFFCKPIFNQWSGAYVANSRRDLFFIGDSIAWGYGVTQADAFPRKVQNAINVNLSHADAGWVAWNITTDDWTSGSTSPVGPFNGGLSGSPKLTTVGVTQGATGPLSGYQGNKSGGSPVYTEPAIRLDSVNDSVSAACSNATYFILTASCTGTSGGCTVVGASNTSYAKSYDMLPGQYSRYVFGPFTDATSVSFTLAGKSGDAVVDVVMIHPTVLYPSTFLNVHVNARSSHSIADFLSKTKEIKESALHRVGYPFEQNAQPIFVLSLGSVSIYDPTRQVNPTTYASQLTTLATSLSSGDYPGQVVLTIPPVPTGAWTPTSGFTHANFASAIVGVANNLGLYYIDFTSTLVSGDYQADGINPTAAGHTKLADLYVSSLVTGTSSNIALMTGAASGSATVLGSSSSSFIGVGAASGSATVSGIGRSIRAATGASAGMATTNFVGINAGSLYSTKRRSLVMIGASVVWGDGLDTQDTYAFKMQEAIDSRLGIANESAPARFIHADDMESGAPVPAAPSPLVYPVLSGSSPPIYTVPFNGFEKVSGYGAGINNPDATTGYRFNPLVSPYEEGNYGRSKLNFAPYNTVGRPSTVADGPFGSYSGNKSIGLPYEYKDPQIRLNAAGQNIRFSTINVPQGGGVLYLVMQGTSGAKVDIYGATGFDNPGDFDYWAIPVPSGNPIDADGVLPVGTGNGIRQPVTTTPRVYVFPLNAKAALGQPQGMSINFSGAVGSQVDIRALWLTTAVHPANHISVQVCARNSYCLQDYYFFYELNPINGNVYQRTDQPLVAPQGRLNDIMSGVIYNTSASVSSSARAAECDPPYYVLGDTYNSMVTPDRRLSVEDYVKYIEGMGNYLSSPNAICPGIPIVVMPIIAGDPDGYPLISGTTWTQYRDALASLANRKGWRFVDQIDVGISGGDVPPGYVSGGRASGSYPTTFYQVDGLHPTPTGATAIANRYISSLSL